jgi:ribosomal protein S18 acetylase RimI-like enzyme
MDIQIIKASDYKAALDIARKNSHFFNSSGLKTMKEDFKIGFLFGAYDRQELVGFICFKELNEKAVELAWMAVEPEYKGKGVGTSLVNEGLKLLSKKYYICEMKTLSEIDPDPEYAKTRIFYQKLGFIPLETINPYPGWGKGNPCQIFVKILDAKPF